MAAFGLALLLLVALGIVFTGLPAFVILIGAATIGAAAGVLTDTVPLSLLSALDMRLNANEIAVVGEGAAADSLLHAARKLPHATRIVLHARNAGALATNHPAQAKLAAVTGAAAFVCRGQSCSLPVTTAEELGGLVHH